MKKLVVLTPLLLLYGFCLAQDLLITDVSGPTSFRSHEIITLDITLTNQGVVDIMTRSFSNIYLSDDDKFDDFDDHYIGFVSLPALPAGSSVTFPVDIEVPELAPGSYYLMFSVDKGKAIDETDEGNNIRIDPGYTVTSTDFDFIIPTLALSKTTIGVHDYAAVNYRVQNGGSSQFNGSLYTGFYLSHDAILDDSDELAGAVYTSIEGTAFMDVSDRVTLPAGTVPGNYYLIARADDVYSSIQETTETNNTRAVPITVVADDIDLDIASGSSNYAFFMDVSQRNITLNFDISNSGTTGAIGYTADVYLSVDATLDASDVRLNFHPIQLRYNGQYVPAEGSGHIVLDVPVTSQFDAGGRYYVFVTLNADNAIPEANHSNNTWMPFPVNITPANYRIQVKSLALAPNSNDSDWKTFRLDATFENMGDDVNTTQQYSLQIKDASAVTVGSMTQVEHFSYFYESSTRTSAFNVTLANGLPAGTYSVQLSCLSPTGCITDSYTTSIVVPERPHRLAGTIRGEDGTAITTGKLFLYRKDQNGSITIAERVTPTTSDAFTLMVDRSYYTLYFIPDATQYPQYVPTVIGKTIALNNRSFFRSTADTTVLFSVLKIQQLAEGSKTISGSVHDEESAPMSVSGKGEKPLTGNGNYIVILTTQFGAPMRVTKADAAGYYQFTKVPDGLYRVNILPDNDRAPAEVSVAVDVSVKNARADFQITGTGSTATVTAISLDQQISLNEIPSFRYGMAPYQLIFSATSKLPVTGMSSDPDIVSINGNVVTVHAAGETTITFSQPGNEIYNAAPSVQRVIRIGKANQKINFNTLSQKTYGDASFTLSAISDAGLAITYESSNNNIVSIDGTTVSIKGAGDAIITAKQTGGNNHNAADPVGQNLRINKKSQSITFAEIGNRNFEDGAFALTATTTSSLGVTYTSDNTAVATVEGNVIAVKGIGTAKITAQQQGNANFLAATPVSRTLTVSTITGVMGESSALKIYPNPTNGIVYIEGSADLTDVVLVNLLGEARRVRYKEHYIDLGDLAPGVYYLKVNGVLRKVIKL